MTGRRPGWFGAIEAIAAIAVVAACFSPQPTSGLPCTDAGACPGDQVCTNGLCQEPGGGVADGRPDDDDAAAPDATPIGCVDASTCPIDAPVCDPGTMTCRRCVADNECPSDACLEFAGTCTDEGATLYVTPTGTANGVCSRPTPCQRLCQAEGVATAARNVIKIADGTYTSETCTFGLDTALVVVSGADLAPAGATIRPSGQGIQLRSGANVLIEGVVIDDAPSDGINQLNGTLELQRVVVEDSGQAGVDMRDGTLRLVECTIVSSGANGLFVNNGVLEVSRSTFVANSIGAMRTDGTLVTVVDSMIAGNGTGTGGSAVELDFSLAGSRFAHNTVAGNLGAGAPVMKCSGGGGALTISSTIFADNQPGQIESSCAVTYSLFSGTPAPGIGNIMGAASFVSPVTGDYHITAGSAARDVADPASTEPVDFDGEPRPQGAGRDIGADEIP